MSSFSDELVRRAWRRSGGRCECLSKHSIHSFGRCSQKLLWSDRRKEKETGWIAHHKITQEKGGSDSLSNCEIICRRCLKATRLS